MPYIPRCLTHGLVAALLALVFPVIASSAVLYVDRDSSCPGTGATGTPYCNLQNAFNVVNPGDTIRIRDSASPYDAQSTLTRTGTSGAGRITIEPDIGHNPTMRYTGNGASTGAILLQNVSYVTVQNFTFDGAGVWTSNYAVRVRVPDNAATLTGNEIKNNIFRNWGGTQAQVNGNANRAVISLDAGFAIPRGTITGTVVSGNTFTNNRGAAMYLLHVHNSLIENNTITGMLCARDVQGQINTEGIKLVDDALNASTGNIIRNNIIGDFQLHSACTLVHQSNPFQYDFWAGIWCDVGPGNGEVSGNLIYNIGQDQRSGWGTSASAGINIEDKCSGWTLKNNIAYNIGFAGMGQRSASSTNPNIWYNNTSYGNGGFAFVLDNGVGTLRNNLFVGTTGGIGGIRVQNPGAGHSLNYNLWWNTDAPVGDKVGQWGAVGTQTFAQFKAASGQEANGLNVDPRLANAAGNNFNLCTAVDVPDASCIGASPAIDAGTFVGIAFSGGAPDIGAIESGGSATTPAALWRMDETGTTTSASDSSGNGVNLTLCNTTTCPQQGPTWIAGSVNNAASFDGTSDYMEVANSSFLEFVGDMTFAAWVGTTSAASQMLVSKELMGSCGTPYLFEMTAQHYVYYHCGPGSDEGVTFDSYTIPTDGVRHHVAIVRTITSPARTLRLYIDGVLTQTETWAAAGPATNTVSLRVGKSHDVATPRWLVGSLDEVRLVNHAMTASEILALAEEGDVTPPPFTGMSTTHHKFYSADKPEGAKPLSAEDGSANIRVDGKFRLRFGIANETGVGVTSQIYPLKCQVEADPIFSVTSSCTTNPVCLATDTRVVNGANTSQLLTLDSPLTFIPGAFINGAIPPWPTRTLTDDDTLEHEYSLKLSGIAAGEDVCCWPVFGSAETLFDSYTPAAGACWVVTAGKQVHR